MTNVELANLNFDERIKAVSRQLLGSKLSVFAWDTADKLTLAFEKQRTALMDLLHACQSDLDDILTGDILFPPVRDLEGGAREMDEHERTEYRRTLIDNSAARLAQSVATLEKMVNLFTKLTGGGVGQAMLAVAKAGLERAVHPVPADEPMPQLGNVGPGKVADETSMPERQRFRAGRGAVVIDA
jgi:hypothetical protein